MGDGFSGVVPYPDIGQLPVPVATSNRYTLKLLTDGQVGEGVHSVHVKFTQWNPWPESVTVTEFPGAGIVTTTVAVRLPPCLGVKVTSTVQLAFPASIPPVSGHVVPIA